MIFRLEYLYVRLCVSILLSITQEFIGFGAAAMKRSIGNLSILAGGILTCLGSPQVAAQSSKAATTDGMRVCNTNESPIVLVEGVRVQVCRKLTAKDVGDFMNLLATITPKPASKEAVQSEKLCLEFLKRENNVQGMPYCEKASSLGRSTASYALGMLAVKENPERGLFFLSLASDQGDKDASLYAGALSYSSDREASLKHFKRCYQPTINGDAYNKGPYSPSSKTAQKCTDTLIKMVLSGKFEAADIYQETAVIQPSINGEISFGEYQQHLNMQKRRYSRFLINWDSYKDSNWENLRFVGKVQYRIWMVRDKPVLCIFRDAEGKMKTQEVQDALCRHFQINYRYKSAMSSKGSEISGMLSGSINLDLPRKR